MHCNVFQLQFENVWLKAKQLQQWLFCLMRQNRYCLCNTKISVSDSAMKTEKHRYRPKKTLSDKLQTKAQKCSPKSVRYMKNKICLVNEGSIWPQKQFIHIAKKFPTYHCMSESDTDLNLHNLASTNYRWNQTEFRVHEIMELNITLFALKAS